MLPKQVSYKYDSWCTRAREFTQFNIIHRLVPMFGPPSSRSSISTSPDSAASAHKASTMPALSDAGTLTKNRCAT
jgi:hypothetical protein